MKKVLVLDDDWFIRDLIKVTLKKYRYEVQDFEDVEDLFSSGELENCELLLLDVNLKSCSGTDVLKRIKSEPSLGTLPVIMITGDQDNSIMEECFREGAFDYITKPLNEIALKSRIDSAITHYSKFSSLGKEIYQLKHESENLNAENQQYEKKIKNLELFHKELSETTQHLAAATWRERKSKEELNTALTELKVTKEKVEESNKKIVASINYAKKIQNAFLPPTESLDALFSEYFILYRPKDIVSGDFYWCWSNERYHFVGVFDCTGHGVPGAFMSLIGLTLLKETVQIKGIYQIDEILKNLDSGICQILNQETTENHDGMDASLLRIDTEEKTLQFCGAHNPLLYFSGEDLNIIKGSRSSIGGNRISAQKELDLHELPLSEVDEVYLISDGFQDQFGGAFRKKIGIKQVTEFLSKIHNEPMVVQHEKLKNLLDEWMTYGEKPESQIDDISFMGIRLKGKY